MNNNLKVLGPNTKVTSESILSTYEYKNSKVE